MKPSRREEESSSGDNEALRRGTQEDENGNTSSLLIVILSLVFVAVFGCALVGGVISGDPTNGFFITIIVASAIAISVAIGVSMRYIFLNRNRDGDNNNRFLSKENIRGTFSGSDEENQYEEDNVNEHPLNRNSDCHFRDGTHIESEIKEIHAKSVVGEMSALSPHSYDGESLSSFRHHIIKGYHNNGRQGLDFSCITADKQDEKVKIRQDPPEGVGIATLQAAWNTRAVSQDPSAPKFSTDGEIIDDQRDANDEGDERDGDEDDAGRDPTNDEESTVPIAKRRKSRRSRSRSISKSRSPSVSRSAKSPSNSEANFSSKRKKKEKKTKSLHPSGAFSVPSTPAASEAGSFASSFFNMFGKSKKTSSEAGSSENETPSSVTPHSKVKDATTTLRKANASKPMMVRPPMIPPSNRKGGDILKTIDGRVGQVPSTPGNKSTFTIPPPRPIPRTPMGSEIFSEFHSVAESGAVSSTFDPQAHQMALEKMRNNQAPIGANPVDNKELSAFYDDDEDHDDEKENSVDPSSAFDSIAFSYDVFAPPGSLGIVVDTTEKGCIVYSLKKSSPMQGLMNRGDLIIGLDNFDVRNMSAASLTKLMAKKSEQAERKFTLVPNNS